MQATAYSRTGYGRSDGSRKLASFAAIVALHVALLAALWQLEPVRSALQSAPILVSLIQPAAPKIEPPKPLPQKAVQRPQPVPPKRATPTPVPSAVAPVITAAPEAPSMQSAPPPAPAPAEPAPAAAPTPAVAAAPAAPPTPVAVTPPRFNADYLNNPAPAYPPLARRMGEEGKVVLRVHVNERGLPDEVQVRTTSGSERLDKAAQEAVRHWRFVPARRGDTPVAEWVAVPISFSLRS